jgi:hypothetical protein
MAGAGAVLAASVVSYPVPQLAHGCIPARPVIAVVAFKFVRNARLGCVKHGSISLAARLRIAAGTHTVDIQYF